MTKDNKNYLGLQNAKKEVTRSTMLQIRVFPRDKSAWVKQAKAENMKLSAWAEKTLNAKA